MTNTEKLNCLTDRPCTVCKYHKENGCSKWSCVFEQEPTTKNETLVSLDVYKQVAKERDIAIQQLHELGYDFGQKIEPTTKNNLGVDCISREQAINAVNMCSNSETILNLQQLPSVTPQEPKTGHWITKPHVYGVTYCSECDFELRIDNTNYCPNCGAKMTESEDT